MKADRTYVYQGTIYLPGAELPVEIKELPKPAPPHPGVNMFGPEGKLEMLPHTPLPVNFAKLEESPTAPPKVVSPKEK